MRVRARACGIGATLLLAACGSSFGDGENALYECQNEETPLEDDDTPAPLLGFAAQEILDWALGEREERARFLPLPDGVSSDVAPGELALRFALTRAEGDAVQVEQDPACGGSGALRIPVELALTTEAGELDERAPGTLAAERADFARLEAALDLTKLSGSWTLTLDDPGLRVVGSGVGIALTADGSAGQLGVMLERRTADAVTLTPGHTLVRWPAADTCGAFEVPRALPEDDGEWLAPMADLRLTQWATPEAASPARSATMTITPRDVVCEAWQGERYAPFLVQLRLDDDASEVELPAILRHVDGGLELALDPRAVASDRPDAFIARFGDFGLGLAGFEAVALELSLTVEPSGASGVFAVVAFDDTCQAVCDSRGCSGCGPATAVRLLELALQAP